MKRPIVIRSAILMFAALTLTLATMPSAPAQNVWSGNGSSLNWSDNGNWTGGAPAPSQTVQFGDSYGYTNGVRLMNNIVDANSAIGTAYYTAQAASGSLHFYTTLIPGGVSLTLGGLGFSSPALAVGDVPGSGNWLSSGSATNYTTLTGAGSLLVNDATSLLAVGMRNRATLDLGNLNYFNANLQQLWVAVTADNPNTTGPTGVLLLGMTNNITTAPNPNAPGILLGSATNGSGTATVFLGNTNAFDTDGLVVGGRRAGFGTLLAFGPNASNTVPLSTFTLRGSAGNTAASIFSIGDLAADATSYNAIPSSSAGSSTANFSGGNVDIWADSLYIGRSTPGTGGSGSATGQGTLIVENGTVTATNVFMSYKMTATNTTAGSGVLLLRSNATMNVVKDLYLCYRTNGSTFINQPILGVSNNAVLNVGGNINCTQIGGWTPATINLGGGIINMTGAGSVSTPNILGVGSITGSSGITVTNILTMSSDATVGTLNLGDNLTLGSAVKLTFNLGADNTVGGGVNDYLDVANDVTFNSNPLNTTFSAPLVTGTYKLIGYGGTQSGTVSWVNPTRSAISLVQGSGQVALSVSSYTPATLIWKGPAVGGGNWDNSTTNWNNNTDRFFALDNVVFDDTGVATNITIAAITNVPGSITFSNNVNKYVFIQSGNGAIGGFTSLNKYGTGTLVMGGGGFNNYFTGTVSINQGTFQMGSFNTGVFGVADSVSAINIANGAMLDLNGQSIGSSGSYGRAVNFVGTGIGGAGAIAHNGASSNPSLSTRNIVMTGDATVGCASSAANITLAGVVAPYVSTMDLGGHTLTTTGNGGVRLNQLTITNSGSITVNNPFLGVNSLILDGPGTINLGSKYLNFYSTFTTGYVGKAISAGNGAAISAASVNATPIPLRSPISIANNGILYFTNSQIILASGPISGFGAGITKFGNSNLVLSATNTYTGQTTVSGGRLVLSPVGTLASSLIQVDTPASFDVSGWSSGYTLPSGQSLNVNGVVAGNITAGSSSAWSGFGTNVGSVTISTGGVAAPGNSLVQGTLTVSNDLTFTGGTAIFKLADTTTAGGGVNDLIVVGGNLNFTGPTSIRIQPVATLSTQPYTLFTYTGMLSGIGNVTVTSDSRYTYTLSTGTPGIVTLSIAGAAGDLVWHGGAPSAPNAWDVVTTSNWLNGANADRFYQGDTVTFDDTALTTLVTMAAQVKPAAITNNASGAYVLNGNGSLLAGSLFANSGSLTIANTNNNLFNGPGISLNGGSVTFNQPNAASLTAKLSGTSGSLNKAGANTLTLTSPDSSGLNAPVNINGGTLRQASANPLGSGTVTVAPGATLDLNGQPANASTLHASGSGADGLGAINNRGIAQTNAVFSLTLDGDVTLGAASNRWDIAPPDTNGTPGTLQGNSHNLTKTGNADLWIRQLSDTALANIDVTAGRLIFAGPGTLAGSSSANIYVRTNATLGFANGFQDPGKPTLIAAGAQLYSTGGNNQFGGDMTLSNGLAKFEPNAQLTLGGKLSGPATLTVQGVVAGNFGTLTLTGSNSYSGGTIVNDGELDFGGTNSMPANTNVVLSSRVVYNTSGHPVVGLLNNFTSPVSVRLDMQTVGSAGPAQAYLSGNGGTWAGPIKITGNDPHCTANFISGLNGLTIAGAVDGSAFIGNASGNGGVKINGDNVLVSDVSLGGVGVRFNNPLQFSGTLSCVNSGLGGLPGMTKLALASGNNSWTNMFWNRGILQIGADNALPQCPITVGTLASGADHRVILDLNGHAQTLVNWIETFLGNDTVWFGNSSTNADAVLTYAGAGTNSWSAYIIDAFDTNAPVQRTTALNVASGYLRLMPFPFGDPDPNSPGAFPSGPPPYPFGMTYTGPTAVTGGTLQVNKYLGLSPVTVSGTGTLSGNGVIGGTLNVTSGGTVAPGTNIIGSLTVSNNVVFGSGSKAAFRINLTTGTNDQLVGISNLTVGGTIMITNVGAQPFTNGTIIKLFSAASYVAGPVTIQPSVPASGLVWDASYLALDGTLRVVTPVATTISGVSRLNDNNVGFTINGGLGQAYSVRASTNIGAPYATWTVLESSTLPSVSYVFSDRAATNFPARFYIISTP